MTGSGGARPPGQAAAVVAVGRIAGVYGIRGWVRVYSYTEPRTNILAYSPWRLSRPGLESSREVVGGRAQGQGVVAQLAGIEDRDGAAALIGAEILVDRAQLGEAGEQRFFWVDLEGMEVRTPTGVLLGVVDHLFATGANDVMVVQGDTRRLIPFVLGQTVSGVDQERRVITADWPEDE